MARKVARMRTRHVWANINKVDEKVREGEEVADGWNGSAWVKSMRGALQCGSVRLTGIESFKSGCNAVKVSLLSCVDRPFKVGQLRQSYLYLELQ